MTPKIVHLVAAARPNMMKIAPLYHALQAQKWCRPLVVHTGQHYDANMSDAFCGTAPLRAAPKRVCAGA